MSPEQVPEELVTQAVAAWIAARNRGGFIWEDAAAHMLAAVLPIQIGWYCWKCHAINATACRSDSVPVYVPREWEQDMIRELEETREH